MSQDSTSYTTRNDAKGNAFDYIEMFHNRKRQHLTLDYRFPHPIPHRMDNPNR